MKIIVDILERDGVITKLGYFRVSFLSFLGLLRSRYRMGICFGGVLKCQVCLGYV